MIILIYMDAFKSLAPQLIPRRCCHHCRRRCHRFRRRRCRRQCRHHCRRSRCRRDYSDSLLWFKIFKIIYQQVPYTRH